MKGGGIMGKPAKLGKPFPPEPAKLGKGFGIPA